MNSDWSGETPLEWVKKKKIDVKIPKIGKNIFGPTPPNLFVGEYGYPNVFVGPLVGLDSEVDARLLDSPDQWYGLTFDKIIEYRANLARGMKKTSVFGSRERFLGDLKDSVMSEKTIDLEVSFKKLPSFNVSFFNKSQPMGPSAELEKMDLAGNPVIPRKIDSLSQENLTVREALPEVVGRFDYYYLQKVFSAGILGNKKKMVPTKWSITAVDNLVADYLLKEIKEFPENNSILLYSNTYLFNHFEVILLPGRYEFEQFEAWEGHDFAYEHEPFEGRTKYAESEGGGFYASRFSVCDALRKQGRQARVCVIREISKEYSIPVGVWEVRENVKHAFENQPMRFSSIKELKDELRTRLKNPLEKYLAKSNLFSQKKLFEY
ncbi:hypothetical protein HUU53_00335 [Candidatus Micrarchaeota archaeon]|nr:hypothetical protein [Candidatus Micrarchaeota archaeon]